MRVRISYGVELQDLPELSTSTMKKALDLLVKDLESLQEINNLVASLSMHSPEAALDMTSDLAESIDNFRKTLSMVDLTLGDFGSILEGYHNSATPELDNE